MALLLALTSVACQAQGGAVTVIADGQEHSVIVREASVREILEQAGVKVGQLDLVSPDTWQMVKPGDSIIVTRVRQEYLEMEQELPFSREVVHNEALPSGEQRLAQKGKPGLVSITYSIIYSDGLETERTETGRQVLEEPVNEIVVVGAQDSFTSVPITGTVAYLSGGNAWVMRETSGNRRPLTSWGDLDGRVFNLSPDGRYLIFTRAGGTEPDTPLNSLWIITTTVLGESPLPLGLENLIFAEWSPDGKGLAYSTAEHTGGRPGWKALNDLWLASFPAREGKVWINPARLKLSSLLPSSGEGAFSWWGANYAWSPNGKYIAYARPDQIGVIDVAIKLPIRLIEFTEYNTYSDWVWVSTLSWSPDSRFILCTVHKPSAQGFTDEDSPSFDMEIIAVDRSVHSQIARDAGMWAGGQWSAFVDGSNSYIAYGLAQQPYESDHSRYELFLRDRDGSNPRRLYPLPGDMGLTAPPQFAWSPAGNQMLIIHGGNLYLLEVTSGLSRQLTGDGVASLPRWRG